MIKPYPVRVTEEIKTGRSSEAVIASVIRGEPLPKGDIGAFLVGVFACRPLTNDGKSYDPKILKQWRHCRYKTEWQTALRGEDIFTDQQRTLILAGEVLLERYGHKGRDGGLGWGHKAAAQPHVRGLLMRWRHGPGTADTGTPVEAIHAMDGGGGNVEVRRGAAPIPTPPAGPGLTREIRHAEAPPPDSGWGILGVERRLRSDPSLTLFDIARTWLVECAFRDLHGFDRKQVELIVDLHLDPQNYTIDRITDYGEIRDAILREELMEQVSELLHPENVSTMLGVFRVHCRNMVNRNGISDINQGGANRSKAPKILAFLDSLDESSWHSFHRIEDLARHYIEVMKSNRSGTFSSDDMRSMTLALELGGRLQSMQTRDAIDVGIMQGWFKVLRCISGGISYFRQFDMSIEKFMAHVSKGLESYDGILDLLRGYQRVPEIGPALAANFFADLGFREFCKPDTHVCDVINGMHGRKYSDLDVFHHMQKLARESGVPPRMLDKVFYLAGSGRFYLIDRTLQGKSMERKEDLIRQLRLYMEKRK